MVADCLIPGLCFLLFDWRTWALCQETLVQLWELFRPLPWACTPHCDGTRPTLTAPWFSWISPSFLFWKYSKFRKFERQRNEPLYMPHQDLPIPICLSLAALLALWSCWAISECPGEPFAEPACLSLEEQTRTWPQNRHHTWRDQLWFQIPHVAHHVVCGGFRLCFFSPRFS